MLVVPSDRLDEVELYKKPNQPASLLVTFHSRKGVKCKSVVDAFKMVAHFENPTGTLIFFIHPEKIDDTWRTEIELSNSSAERCCNNWLNREAVYEFVNDADFVCKFSDHGLVSRIQMNLDEREQTVQTIGRSIYDQALEEGF